jgi:hypothetical protein
MKVMFSSILLYVGPEKQRKLQEEYFACIFRFSEEANQGCPVIAQAVSRQHRLPPLRPGFDPRSGNVGVVVGTVALM